VAAAVESSVVASDEPFDTEMAYAEACNLACQGRHDEARLLYASLDGSLSCVDGGARLRALIQNDLAVMAAMDGRFDEARSGWQTALEVDRDCLVARLNRDLVEAEIHRDQASEGFGELKLAPAPMPSPLLGEGGPEGRMRGRVSHGCSPPSPALRAPSPHAG
jgi:hypothetical protein